MVLHQDRCISMVFSRKCSATINGYILTSKPQYACAISGRGRLGASTFRSLHSGLICLELSYSVLLAAAIATNNAIADSPTVSSGAGAFGIAVFAGYQLYTYPNPKKTALPK